MTATNTPPKAAAMVAMDPEMLERARALQGRTDQRVSASSQFAVYEIDRMRGGFEHTATHEKRESMLVIPLLIRETRSYWARTGSGDPPDCRSINGVTPVDDREGPDDKRTPPPMAENCADCPWNKFGTADNGGGKKCKTKGVIFGVEVGADGTPKGPVVLRCSLSNRSVNASLAAANAKCEELRIPRVLTVWKMGTAIAPAFKKTPAYTHLTCEVVGPCRPQDCETFITQAEGLANEGADAFLTRTPDRDSA